MPIFIGLQDGRFVVANKIERVYQLLDTTRLHIDREGLVRSVLSADPHEHTLFQEIFTLDDRRRLIWTGAGLDIQDPADGGILRALADGKGDPREGNKRIDATLERYGRRYIGSTPVGFQLSCGVDSSLVAGYFADHGHKPTTTTTVYPGEYGRSLARKLEAFGARFGGTSAISRLSLDHDYPLADMARNGRWQPFYSERELYSETFARLARHLAEQGIQTVFTGHGGDELCQDDTLESIHEDNLSLLINSQPSFFTPAFMTYARETMAEFGDRRRATPLIAASLLTGNINGSNVSIDYNVWPVNPLSDPELYWYCQSLPIKYRAQKAILRAYHTAHRFPKIISEANYLDGTNEEFGPYFHEAVGENLRPHLANFMDNSVLARHKFVDKDEALRVFDAAKAKTTPEAQQELFKAYQLLVTEINLQVLGVTQL